MKTNRNAKGGTNTVELGPALFIILIVIFIPCIDIMHIALAYGCGWYANHLAVREAAVAGPGKAQTAADTATAAWAVSGIGKFVKAPPPQNAVVCPFGEDIDGDGRNDYCEVTTRVQVTPMFALPFVASAPVTFQYSAVRPLEEKDLR